MEIDLVKTLLHLLPFLLLWTGCLGDYNPACFEEGECRGSLNIDEWQVSDAQGCLDECRGRPECEYWSYLGQEGSCLGFVNCAEFGDCEDCYSGNRTCQDLQCWVSGRCDGTLILESSVDASRECLQACKEEEGCTWFTYDFEDGACLLYTDCLLIDTRNCDTCTSGQAACSNVQGWTKVVVVGGILDNPDLSLDDVEALESEDGGRNCLELPEYPAEAHFAVSANIGGRAVVCGGFNLDLNVRYSECHSLGPGEEEWEEGFAELLVPRLAAASSQIGSSWLITGGSNEGGVLDSSEIFTDGEFEEGPVLPVPMEHHCQVTLNATHVLVADSQSSGATYLLDFDRRVWIEAGSSLSQSRDSAACGAVDSSEGGREVVVAGEGTAEIFSLKDMEWRSGPDLSVDGVEHSSAQLLDTFLVLGGRSASDLSDAFDSVLRFDPGAERWEVLGTRMRVARGGAAAVTVDNAFVQCP